MQLRNLQESGVLLIFPIKKNSFLLLQENPTNLELMGSDYRKLRSKETKDICLNKKIRVYLVIIIRLGSLLLFFFNINFLLFE